MKDLKDIITEKLRLDNNLKKHTYTCQPETKDELTSIIEERLKEDKNADLNDIDVSQITDMSLLFKDLDPHDIKIDKWDVSNVNNMRFIFFECENFNDDLSKWDVSNVKDMQCMFYGCAKFNCDLHDWNVSNVKHMLYMFAGCKSLKKIPDWYKK